MTNIFRSAGCRIDVTNIDPAALLAGLHNNATMPVTAPCVYDASKFALEKGGKLFGNVSTEQAREELVKCRLRVTWQRPTPRYSWWAMLCRVEEAERVHQKLPSEVDDMPEEGYVPHFPDYLFGRPIKAFLKKGDDDRIYLVRTDLYDRDAGEGKALEVVLSLRLQAKETDSSTPDS